MQILRFKRNTVLINIIAKYVLYFSTEKITAR